MQPVPTVELRAEDVLNSTTRVKVLNVETSEAPGDFTTVTLTLQNDYPNEITGYVVTHGNDTIRKDCSAAAVLRSAGSVWTRRPADWGSASPTSLIWSSKAS
jgi:hypothetical protein